MNDFETRYKGKHRTISFIKSGVRIAACFGAALMLPNTVLAITVLGAGIVFAEVLGIAEEIF